MTSQPAGDTTGSLNQPARPERPGWLPRVDTARCTGCGWCVAACDLHLLYAPRRHQPLRVRVLVDFLAERVAQLPGAQRQSTRTSKYASSA